MNDIDEMIAQYGRTLYGLCLKLTENRFDADDLYQKTLITAMGKRINRDKNPKAFLIKICINLWQNERGKTARRRRIAPEFSIEGDELDIEADESVSEHIEEEELKKALLKAVSELDEIYKTPILLYYGAEMSNEEGAYIMNCSQGTFKSRLFRAKTIVKRKLEDVYEK